MLLFVDYLVVYVRIRAVSLSLSSRTITFYVDSN